MTEKKEQRLLGRKLARELTLEELREVVGANCDPTRTQLFNDTDEIQ